MNVWLVAQILMCAQHVMGSNMVFQYSTVDAFVQGLYDGEMTFSDILKHGNFGIGGQNQLNGEILILDGVVYEMLYDGQTHVVPGDRKTSLAWVTHFTRQPSIEVEAKSKSQFEQWLKTQIHANQIYAIRIEGTFDRMFTRSMPPQTKPYQNLTSIIDQQCEMDWELAKGVMVGFWFPKYVRGINMPAFHFHFLPNDRLNGGHVLDFHASSIQVEIMKADGLSFQLPDTKAFNDLKLPTMTEQQSDEIKDPHRNE